MLRSLNRPDILVVTLAAAGVLMVTMGATNLWGWRQLASTGLGIATISLALGAKHGAHSASGWCSRRHYGPHV